ncbi:hypothetical protein NXS19_005174 [Fusarium pseudograminearum]|nr:hypothetical protein NXS19_005174 [Fusarium pseudograminearum]
MPIPHVVSQKISSTANDTIGIPAPFPLSWLASVSIRHGSGFHRGALIGPPLASVPGAICPDLFHPILLHDSTHLATTRTKQRLDQAQPPSCSCCVIFKGGKNSPPDQQNQCLYDYPTVHPDHS